MTLEVKTWFEFKSHFTPGAFFAGDNETMHAHVFSISIITLSEFRDILNMCT